MRSRCIREAEERERDNERERKAVMQELKQASITLWTSHQRYHCAADTPSNERIDAIETSRGKCKPASRTPKTNKCSKCATTLAAARRMSSDVITTDGTRGIWRCRHCDDRENKKEEQKGKASRKKRTIITRMEVISEKERHMKDKGKTRQQKKGERMAKRGDKELK